MQILLRYIITPLVLLNPTYGTSWAPRQDIIETCNNNNNDLLFYGTGREACMIAAWGSSLWSDCAAASKGGCCSQPSVDAMPQTDAHFQAIIPCLCPPMAMHMHTGTWIPWIYPAQWPLSPKTNLSYSLPTARPPFKLRCFFLGALGNLHSR